MPNLCEHRYRSVWQGQQNSIMYFLILFKEIIWMEGMSLKVQCCWVFSGGKITESFFFFVCLEIYLLTSLFRTMCSREWKCAIYSDFWYLLFHLWWSKGLNLSLVWIEDLQFSDIISNCSISKGLKGIYRVLFYSNLYDFEGDFVV